MKLKSQLYLTITAALAFLVVASTASAAIYIRADGAAGDVGGPDSINGQWFVADSFAFGVEREMKESGEKGGTSDLNIGVGELQECTISKSMDAATGALAQMAASGRGIGNCEVCISLIKDATATPICYLRFRLDGCYVKSWNITTQGDERPTEEVAFYYNKIAFGYKTTKDGREVHADTMTWDNVKNKRWEDGDEGILDDIEPLPPETP